LPRQQTLRAAIDWSYSLLSTSERTLFARLAVFGRLVAGGGRGSLR
jgi:predicted ATPase